MGTTFFKTLNNTCESNNTFSVFYVIELENKIFKNKSQKYFLLFKTTYVFSFKKWGWFPNHSNKIITCHFRSQFVHIVMHFIHVSIVAGLTPEEKLAYLKSHLPSHNLSKCTPIHGAGPT